MSARARAARRLAAAVVASILLCTPAAAIGATSPLLDQDVVVATKAAPEGSRQAPKQPAGTKPGGASTTPDGSTTTPDGTTTTPGGTTTTPDGNATTQDESGSAEGEPPTPARPLVPPPVAAQTLRTDPGAGSAAAQSDRRKRVEARNDCTAGRPPNSRMLATGGLVGIEERPAWVRGALLLAAGFAAIALFAFAARHRPRRRGGAAPASVGLLETISAVVAIAGTLVAIAGQFVSEPPPAAAKMTVRDVLPRITRSEYARRTDTDRSTIRPLDRLEVGNVVWLEIRLEGYRGKRLDLQYATYNLDPAAPGTLLRGTDNRVRLRVADDDTQTSFVPIWVAYPKSKRFEAQFRLIDGREVRQLAVTGRMKGSAYRYACPRGRRAV
jgi:hypothetical protein